MRHILITGGTGSFGKTMAKRLLKEPGVEKITVFSRDELKQHEMRHEYDTPKIDFIVGDIRDPHALEWAMNGPDVVFHAAALKHVPTGEFSPFEMVRTNIVGTQNVIDAAEKSPTVKKFVLLSTDKAVYPINAMGISKAMAERLVFGHRRGQSSTIFTAVRYGNVMASRGSVIPLFIDKIKRGEDITITNPDMTRFLLSLEDAIELVLLAIRKGKQGDLFIKKAPAATVGDIAQALKNILGAKNKVVVVGTRAGEKVHETLATQLELARAEDLGEHYRIKSQGLSYKDFYVKGSTKHMPDDYTSANTEQLTMPKLEKLLLSLPVVKQAQEEMQKGAKK